MSMCRCDRCSNMIDSDYDLECFVDGDDGRDRILCEWCRDNEGIGEDET